MASSKSEILRTLAGQIRGLENSTFLDRLQSFIPSYIQELDTFLPSGGLPQGGLIEVLSDEAIGAFSLCLCLARKQIAAKAAWAVVDPAASFYPPAAAAMGLDCAKLVLVRPAPRQSAWALNQLLRCPDLGASFLDAHALGRTLDNMTYRRLQLAAERGQGLGFILRPREAARRPCWAALRLQVEPLREQNASRLTLLHTRGANSGARIGESMDLTLTHATFSVPLPAALAAAAPGERDSYTGHFHKTADEHRD